MIDAADAHDTCPVCGSTLPDGARFCPVCGNRVRASSLEDGSGGAPEEGNDTAAPGWDQPTAQAPVAAAPIEGPPSPLPPPSPEPTWTTPASDAAWAATPEQWPAGTATLNQSGWRRNRTLWVILAIFGFIVFCCCGILFTLFVISAVDGSFQTQISHAAMVTLR